MTTTKRPYRRTLTDADLDARMAARRSRWVEQGAALGMENANAVPRGQTLGQRLRHSPGGQIRPHRLGRGIQIGNMVAPFVKPVPHRLEGGGG